MGLDFNIDPEEAKSIMDEHTPVEDKPVPTHRLYVIELHESDIEETGFYDNRKIIGYIDEPTVFCPGLNCNEGTGKDPLRYYRKEDTNLWVHAGCGLPTKAWWNSMLHDLMVPIEKGT
jgi:hypothetical protein